MSRNMTRKGLAFGAAASLAIVGVSAMPAQAVGIANDYVVLADTEEHGNYNMLSTGYIEISGSFAFAAESGGELKFYVQDPDEISVFDVVPEGASDTAAEIDETGGNGASASLDADPSVTLAGAGTATATLTFAIDDVSDLVAGDMITITNFAGTLDGNDAIPAGALALVNTTHRVTSVVDDAGDSTFTITIDDSDSDFDGWDNDDNTVTGFDLAENTSATAMDTVAELRIAGFGSAGVVGVETARSTLAATDGNYVVDTNEENVAAGDQVVRFATTSDTAYGSIVVTGWIDNDDDGVIDATEYVSDPVTVSFVVPSAATFTISQENVYITSDSVTAHVTADLNLKEISSQSLLEVSIDHIDNGATVAETDATLTWDATDEDLQGTDADLTNDLAAGDSIRFAVESANTEVGSPATFGVGSLTVAGSVLSIPASQNNTRAYNIDTDGTAMGSQAVTVRKGAQTVTGSVVVYTDDPTDTADNVVVPNVPYTISVTSTAVTAADGVELNGTDVDGGTETITGYTNASGAIALTLTSTAADADDVVTVEIDVQGLDKTALMAFTFAAVDYDVWDVAGELTASTDYNTTIVPGGSLTRTYKVADQWGVAPVNGTHVVTATRSGARTVDAATWSYQVPVVNGLATVTIVDDGAGTGSDTVSIKSAPVLPGGGLDTVDDTNTYTLTYATSAVDVTPSTVTAVANYDGIDDALTNDKAVALEPDALVNFDARATGGANPPAFETYNVDTDGDGEFDDAGGAAQLTISGTVSNANGGVVPGALVTIAAPGAGFKFTTGGTNDIYAVDTITVRTGAAGTYSVDAFGGTGGLKTFTVTAGAASATEDVTFVAGGAVAGFTLSAAAVSEPGKTVDVLMTLSDAYGNPVEGTSITLSSTGPGYLINTTGTTLADGTYSTKLLLGTNDSGTAVVKATVTIDGVLTTKTVEIRVGVGLSEQKVNAGSFKGYVAIYAKGYEGDRLSAKVGKDWVVVPALASNFERVVEYTGAGYTINVPIYINRVLVDTITVTTK